MLAVHPQYQVSQSTSPYTSQQPVIIQVPDRGSSNGATYVNAAAPVLVAGNGMIGSESFKRSAVELADDEDGSSKRLKVIVEELPNPMPATALANPNSPFNEGS